MGGGNRDNDCSNEIVERERERVIERVSGKWVVGSDGQLIIFLMRVSGPVYSGFAPFAKYFPKNTIIHHLVPQCSDIAAPPS